MSSEAEPVTSPPSAPVAPSMPESNGVSDPTQATSEANIAAADPNPPHAIPDADQNDANLDEKAADTAEGAVSGATVVAPDASATPASSKKGSKDNKRRSSGVPEHKSKKKGNKKDVVLNLDCQPGDYYFARMKGHPNWPSIICDEDMLPEAIMATRPVTAQRADGTYREDYQEGGKNAKDRTYAVMFLHTNEFAWMPNVDLTKLSLEDVADPESRKLPKKGLTEAYKLAAEQQPLDHFKQLLADFEAVLRDEQSKHAQKQEEREAKAAKKQERDDKAAVKATKAKRKSGAGLEDEDEEMEDSSEAPKSVSKKRKKAEVDSDGEDKPTKKSTLKLNVQKGTPNGDSAKAKKPKPSKPKETKAPAPISEHDRLEKKSQSVLYLRHKLQKGFLQNTAPEESQMADMANHLTTLEQYKELEVHIIKTTKIHKVLKALLKLDHVPKDEEYRFKARSEVLLTGWLDAMTKEDEAGRADLGTNGTDLGKIEVASESKPTEPKAEEAPKTEETTKVEDTEMPDAPAVTEPAAAPVEATNPGNDAKDEATEGDVSMEDVVLVEKSDIPADVDAATSGPAPAASTETAAPSVQA